MLSVVCFDLVTEAVETNAGVWTAVAAIAFGVAITYFLNYLIDSKVNPEVPHIDSNIMRLLLIGKRLKKEYSF